MRFTARVRIALFCTVIFSGCAENTAPEGAVPRGTAIRNVTTVDAVGGVREHQTVIFHGDEIIAVTAASESKLNTAHNIDGRGKYLIPGLWDMHVHLTYDDRFTAAMPALFLAHGITSVRDTGGLLGKLQPIVAKMRAANAVAPRVFYSGPLLDGSAVVYDGKSRPEIGIQNADTRAAIQNVVKLRDAGVDFIKIYEMVNPDVFAALVGAAQQNHLPIAAHIPLSMYASSAGPNVGSMEHLRNIELDCASQSPTLYEARITALRNPTDKSGYQLRGELHQLQRLEAIGNYNEQRCERTIESLRSTIQVPTLRLNMFSLTPVFARDDWPSVLRNVPSAAREEWADDAAHWLDSDQNRNTDFAKWSQFLIGQMHMAGVPIGAGTDTPIGRALPGYSLHTELELLVASGLTALEALKSATVRPAEFFSLENEMGTITVGKRADLLLLEANPLEDIANSRTIVQVISKGVVYTPESLLSEDSTRQ